MPASRPLLRPALLLERAVFAAGNTVPRAAALALAAWKHLGYVCVAIDCQPGSSGDARARAEIARQREIELALASAGGALDGTYVYPRPGEHVDEDVPRPSVFARLVLEAANKHHVDLGRSFLLAHDLDAAEGARVAGVRCVLVTADGPALRQELAARPAARPDFLLPDLPAVRALVDAERTRSSRHLPPAGRR